MKKNWKKGLLYLWISVIIFLFMAGIPESVRAQERGILEKSAVATNNF